MNIEDKISITNMGRRAAGKSIYFQDMSNYMEKMIDDLCAKIAKEGNLSTAEDILKEAYRRRAEIFAKVGLTKTLVALGALPSDLTPEQLGEMHTILWSENQ